MLWEREHPLAHYLVPPTIPAARGVVYPCTGCTGARQRAPSGIGSSRLQRARMGVVYTPLLTVVSVYHAYPYHPDAVPNRRCGEPVRCLRQQQRTDGLSMTYTAVFLHDSENLSNGWSRFDITIPSRCSDGLSSCSLVHRLTTAPALVLATDRANYAVLGIAYIK